MKSGFHLVWTGLGLAGMGFVATCCYILGLSAGYLGDFRTAAALLVAAAALFFIFARRLRTYFTALENHKPDTDTHD